MADEFGKYMHCGVFGVTVGGGDGEECTYDHPNDHLVTTSFWDWDDTNNPMDDTFPRDQFWANPNYPNLDYADLHEYTDYDDEESKDFWADLAYNTQYYSEKRGAFGRKGASKPLIRGETGFSSEVLSDTEGVWLHNYIWGGLNPGGMYEQYWFVQEHIVQSDNDLRYHYKAFKNFMEDIPLNNGNYEDAQAIVSNENLRAWGQKYLVNGRAHLWIQNKDHTWKKVVDSDPIPQASDTLVIGGFQAGQIYAIEWWDTYTGQPLMTSTIVAQSDGSIPITVTNLVNDVALQIAPVLVGSVTLQGRPAPPNSRWIGVLNVSLTMPGESTPAYEFTPTTDENGTFIIIGVEPGTYEVRVKKSTTLQNVQTVTLVGGTNTIDLGTLREGDANDDNFITILDFSILAAAFGKCEGSSGYDERADFNGDGCVTILDFSLLASNFGQDGQLRKAAPSRSSVAMIIEPASTSVKPGETFKVTMRLDAADQQVDGAQATLKFDPNVLEVQQIIAGDAPSSKLELDLMNQFDNENGTIEFAAGTLEEGASGTFDLVQIQFRALEAGETTLTWKVDGPTGSDVTFGGASVLRPKEGHLDGMVTVSEPTAITVALMAPTTANWLWALAPLGLTMLAAAWVIGKRQQRR
jgi:hypothetical protein